MKKIVLITILSFLLLSFGIQVSAQESELPSPGLLPDSPFYFLETIAEEIGNFFTFGDLKKAERYAVLAAERLAEVQAVVEKGKPEFVEKTLARYENQLNNSIARAKKAQAKGKNTEKVMEVIARVGKATTVHLEVLAEVYEKVPEQVKPAIENAMKASVKGHEKAVAVLKAKDTLGEVPEKVSLPVKVPQGVRERIQGKVQEELEKEWAELQFESFEALEATCLEEGGTPEICASLEADCRKMGVTTADECFRDLSNVRIGTSPQAPLPQSFESWESLRAFCIEDGGPPEICASLEVKCEEVGATTPEECYRVRSLLK